MERDEENNWFVASFHEDNLGELNNDSVPRADIRFYERGNPAESDDSYEPDLWVGFSMTFDNEDEGGVGAVFRRSAAATDSPIVRGLVGAGGLGATYLGYKKLKETGSESTDVEPSEHGIKEREERNPEQRCTRMDPLITDYDDLLIEEPIDKTSQVSIQRASANGHHI